jgi:hypothetical protein
VNIQCFPFQNLFDNLKKNSENNIFSVEAAKVDSYKFVELIQCTQQLDDY